MTESSTIEDFRRLPLWQKAQALASEIASLVVRLPRNRAADVIGNQLMRAAGSVPANIAEGFGRYSKAAYRNHLSIARGSPFEVQSWLDLLQRQGLVSVDECKRLIAAAQEIGRLLTLRMRSLERVSQGSAVRDGTFEYEA